MRLFQNNDLSQVPHHDLYPSLRDHQGHQCRSLQQFQWNIQEVIITRANTISHRQWCPREWCPPMQAKFQWLQGSCEERHTASLSRVMIPKQLIHTRLNTTVESWRSSNMLSNAMMRAFSSLSAASPRVTVNGIRLYIT